MVLHSGYPEHPKNFPNLPCFSIMSFLQFGHLYSLTFGSIIFPSLSHGQAYLHFGYSEQLKNLPFFPNRYTIGALQSGQVYSLGVVSGSFVSQRRVVPRHRFCVSVQPGLFCANLALHAVGGGLVYVVHQHCHGSHTVVVGSSDWPPLGAARGHDCHGGCPGSAVDRPGNAGTLVLAIRDPARDRCCHGVGDNQYVSADLRHGAGRRSGPHVGRLTLGPRAWFGISLFRRRHPGGVFVQGTDSRRSIGIASGCRAARRATTSRLIFALGVELTP